jgi:hypothetical protein
MDLRPRKRLIATIIFFSACMSSCERGTNLSIKDEVSPSFEITGGGYELFFGVGEVSNERDRFGRKVLPIWSFKSKQRSEHKTWPIIVYGKLFDEFEQTFPSQGNPVPLIEGKLYVVSATIYSTSGDSLWFVVKNGKVIEISKPD